MMPARCGLGFLLAVALAAQALAASSSSHLRQGGSGGGSGASHSSDFCGHGGPVPPEGAVRFANTSIVIKAPPATIWGFLVGMEDWKAWNDVFTVKISGAPELGKRFWLSSYLRTAPWPLRHSTVLLGLTELVEERRVCMETQGIPGLSARHCYVFCELESGTLIYNYEDQSGPMKKIVQRMMAQATTDGFARFNEFLRNQSETAASSEH